MQHHTTIEPYNHRSHHCGPIDYRSPQDVPKSLRDSIKAAHDSGLTAEQLSKIYEMPIDWIALFVFDPMGRA